MNKQTNLLTTICVLSTLFALLCLPTFAQSKVKNQLPTVQDEEVQPAPFDFSNKHYTSSGLDPAYIMDRRNGYDGGSVFGYNADWRRSNVRVIETRPAYDVDGSPLYFTLFGDLNIGGFSNEEQGEILLENADSSPIYVFPSILLQYTERQAALIDTSNDNPEQNSLGARVVINVAFNTFGMSEKDAGYLEEMTRKNGESLDGTPIIPTMSDLMGLVNRGLVTLRIRGYGQTGVPGYSIVPLMEFPTEGVITQDAFLTMPAASNGKPSENEMFFYERFECLRANMNERRCYQILR